MPPLGQVSVRDVLDILLVAFLVYQGYLLVAGTRAVNVVRGILVFAGVWVAAQLLNLTTLSYLLGRAGTRVVCSPGFRMRTSTPRASPSRWKTAGSPVSGGKVP